MYGGVLIAVKSELQCSLVFKRFTSELLSMELHLITSASTMISAFYPPPNCASSESAKCVVDELHNIRIDHPSCVFLVSGDINLPDIDRNNPAITFYNILRVCALKSLNYLSTAIWYK